MIERITIRQLMSHTSGLSGSSFPGYRAEHGDSLPSAKDIIKGTPKVKTMRLRLTGLPGYAHDYSGGGFTVQQVIMEAVTGKDLDTYQQESIWGPLGAKSTTFRPVQHFAPNAPPPRQEMASGKRQANVSLVAK